MPRSSYLRRASLPADTAELARYLIGKIVISDIGGVRTSGRIVETEAYVNDDPASHAFRGMTRRNAAMFAPCGHAYIYFIYGMYWCLNVSAQATGVGEAVLIRALEPLDGIETIRARRPGVADRDLLRGPGRVCAGLGIDGALDGLDLCAPGSGLRLACDGTCPALGVSGRIGITRAADRKLRFYARGSRYVSGRSALSP